MELAQLPTGFLSFKLLSKAKPFLLVVINPTTLKNLFEFGTLRNKNSASKIAPLLSGKKGSMEDKLEQAKKQYYKPLVLSTGVFPRDEYNPFNKFNWEDWNSKEQR